MWLSEKDAGKDVTLKDGQEFDFEAAEKEDEEREERRQQREAEEGTDGRRRRYGFRARECSFFFSSVKTLKASWA